MKYANIKYNTVENAPGISLSFFTQGCPHHCPGCFNPETWDFDEGKEFTIETLNSIIEGLTANGIKRSLCILGGEPLCPQNEFLTNLVITRVKEILPETPVYIWTGYIYEQLLKNPTPHLNSILSNTDYLIDGPYVEAERDITLPLRGSRNQRVIKIDKSKFL